MKKTKNRPADEMSAKDALRAIDQAHSSGWEGRGFADPERVLACGRFVLRVIKVPAAIKFGSTHAAVVERYRKTTGDAPPPFFCQQGLVIDGAHRMEACAGRAALIHVPAGAPERVLLSLRGGTVVSVPTRLPNLRPLKC